MSTKIYNGFMLANGTNIFDFSKKVRADFVPKLIAGLHEEFVNTLAQQYDMAYFPETADDYRKAWNIAPGQAITRRDLILNTRKTTAEYVEKIDNFQVKLAFGEDPKTGNMLGYLIGREQYFEELLSYEEVSDYHYQNSSDGPDDVSAKEWKERRKAWDRVLPEGNIPTEMLVATMVNPWDIEPKWINLFKAGELKVEFPGIKSRVYEVAKVMAVTELAAERNASSDEFMTCYFDAIRDSERMNKWSKIIHERIDKNLDYGHFDDLDQPVGENL